MLLNQNIGEAKEQKGLWLTIAEIEVVIKGIPNLIGFCIDYMPASIDIIKPEKFDFADRDLTTMINDIIAKLHSVDMIAKKLGSENTFLKQNMNSIIRNNILVLSKFQINTLEKMSKATGIDDAQLKLFLDSLIKENRIKEENGIYSIVKNGSAP
jgi:hypothetical protein